MRPIPVLLIAFAVAALPALAQSPLSGMGGDGGPINIEAKDSLEYRQEQKQYIARGRAKITRGDFSVTGDTLTADERDKRDGSGNEVYKMTALGNVVIVNGKTTAYGDRADYNVDSQVAILTGRNLRLIAAADTLTARDRFEYYGAENKAIAIGNAKAIRRSPEGTRTITADRMTAYFKKDASGATVADRIEAAGNVKMMSDATDKPGDEDVASGDNGVYTPATNKATLTGDVKLTRGPNQVEGKAAEVDTATGVSRIVGDTKGDGRVRGLIMPGSKGVEVKQP